MNLQKFIEEKYSILNGEITELSMKPTEDGKFIFGLTIRGDGWGCIYGDYDILSEEYGGLLSLSELMMVIGVDDVSKFVGTNVRIAIQSPDEPVRYIGHIVYDNWFNYMKEDDVSEEVVEDVSTKEE